MSDTSLDKASEKLNYEVEKLIAEIRVLRKPWLQPAVSFGGIALAISFSFNLIQWDASNNAAELEGDRQNLEVDRRKIDIEKIVLDSDWAIFKKDKAEREEQRLGAEIENGRVILADLNQNLESAGDSRRTKEEKTAALERAKATLGKLKQSNDAAAKRLDPNQKVAVTQPLA
jgi:hypothetical protein